MGYRGLRLSRLLLVISGPGMVGERPLSSNVLGLISWSICESALVEGFRSGSLTPHLRRIREVSRSMGGSGVLRIAGIFGNRGVGIEAAVEGRRSGPCWLGRNSPRVFRAVGREWVYTAISTPLRETVGRSRLCFQYSPLAPSAAMSSRSRAPDRDLVSESRSRQQPWVAFLTSRLSRLSMSTATNNSD